MPPGLLPCAGVEAVNDFLIVDPVQQDQTLADNDRGAVALADLLLPEEGRSFLAPGELEPFLGGDAIPGRPQKLRPVCTGGQKGHDHQRRTDTFA